MRLEGAKMRTRRRAPAWLRFVTLGSALSMMVVYSSWNGLQGGEEQELAFAGRRELASVNCSSAPICQQANCSFVDGYDLACCTGDEEEDLCYTKPGDTCMLSELCMAELIPGHGSYASCLQSWELNGGAWAYVFIMLFLFVALAIVCDDYFVSSLEKISASLHLSDDVAGATFMAAGSSAPELFVSLADNVIANPPKSVGIGTVVGSAIFNVLVIIGLSAILAGQVLDLDWRPLGRDCCFYVISIILLSGFVWDGEVQWYEALVLLLMYAAYITFMAFNQRFFTWLDEKLGLERKMPELETELGDDHAATPKKGKQHVEGAASFQDVELNTDGEDLAIMDTPASDLGRGESTRVVEAARQVLGPNADNEPGILRPIVRHTVETTRPTAAVEAAAEMSINRHDSDSIINHKQTSDSNATSNSGRHLYKGNPLHQSRNRVAWHATGLSSRNLASPKPHPAPVSRDGSTRMHEKPGLRSVAEAVLRANKTAKTWQSSTGGGLTGTGGSNQSNQSGNGTNDKDHVNEEEEEDQDYWEPLRWPTEDGKRFINDESSGNGSSDSSNHKDSCFQRYCCGWKTQWSARLWYILTLPINLCFRFTIPDCEFDVFREDKEGEEENRRIGFSLTFTMCIVWIAILSHFLVYSATKFGCIVGIKPTVMGLTIVAAGTSVPDAISSIIVARQGQGDMAVANSLGSNVFDILIGLGLPWFIATAFVYQTPSVVLVGDLTISLIFLFGVVICLLGILALFNWQMGKRVGFLLISIYVFYVVFELFVHPTIAS